MSRPARVLFVALATVGAIVAAMLGGWLVDRARADDRPPDYVIVGDTLARYADIAGLDRRSRIARVWIDESSQQALIIGEGADGSWGAILRLPAHRAALAWAVERRT